jgi:hypothetical protein
MIAAWTSDLKLKGIVLLEKKMKIFWGCTAIWYKIHLTLQYQTISLTKKSKIMWILFAVFFMLFLLSSENSENMSTES